VIAFPARSIDDRYWVHAPTPLASARRDTARLGGDAIAGFGSDDVSVEDEHKRDLETKYRTLLEQIPAIVYIWGVPGGGLEGMKEEYVSPQIEEVLGFHADEWMADPRLWVNRLHPDDRAEVIDETARSVEAGEPFKLEYRMVARDGRVVWLHDVASVVARDGRGKATRYQGVQLDITSRKQAEHAQQRTYERLRLIDRERRDLIRRVVGAQEEERRRISEGIHDDTMQGLFRVVHRLRAVAHERPELDDVVAFSGLSEEISQLIARLRRLAFDLHPRIIDEQGLEASLRSLIGRSSSLHESTRFHLDYRLQREPSHEAGLAIYRAAQEALSNAARHSAASNVSILVEERSGGVIMRVEDDGRGFRVDVTASAAHHLGLVSLRERAEILGGWLEIDSDPGGGTRMDYWIPQGIVVGTRGPSGDTDPNEVAGEGRPEEAVPGLLSAREQEVAELLALGHTNAEISTILHLSIRTIEHHRSRVFRKLGVRSRAGVVRALADRGEPRPEA
jgi:two-component system, NarL family, sensor histidine kinase UhpB